YRPLPDAAAARPLFDFAAVPWPAAPPALAWGAYAAGARGERLVGALAGEQHRGDVLLHGPVVSAHEGPDDPLEVAAQLVAATLGAWAARARGSAAPPRWRSTAGRRGSASAAAASPPTSCARARCTRGGRSRPSPRTSPTRSGWRRGSCR